MALADCLRFPLASAAPSPTVKFPRRIASFSLLRIRIRHPHLSPPHSSQPALTLKHTDIRQRSPAVRSTKSDTPEENAADNSSTTDSEIQQISTTTSSGAAEGGGERGGYELSEIKKALKEREGGGGLSEYWGGVAEEVREIEWPTFGKVLGTTGVVLGVIGGSSVVLLTVNAVLAELSDRAFAGKGIQDFFG